MTRAFFLLSSVVTTFVYTKCVCYFLPHLRCQTQSICFREQIDFWLEELPKSTLLSSYTKSSGFAALWSCCEALGNTRVTFPQLDITQAQRVATSSGLFSIRLEKTAIFWIFHESIGLEALTVCNSRFLLLTGDADTSRAMVS